MPSFGGGREDQGWRQAAPILFQLRKPKAQEERAGLALGVRPRAAASWPLRCFRASRQDPGSKHTFHLLGWLPVLRGFFLGRPSFPASEGALRRGGDSGHLLLGAELYLWAGLQENTGRAGRLGCTAALSLPWEHVPGAHGFSLPACCILIYKVGWGKKRRLGWIPPRSASSSGIRSCT